MNSSVMYSYGPPHMAKQKQDNQLEHTYSSYVRIQDVALKTCQKQWMIGRSGERGSGISVLVAHDDDDNLFLQRLIIVIKDKSTLRDIYLLYLLYYKYLWGVLFANIFYSCIYQPLCPSRICLNNFLSEV